MSGDTWRYETPAIAVICNLLNPTNQAVIAALKDSKLSGNVSYAKDVFFIYSKVKGSCFYEIHISMLELEHWEQYHPKNRLSNMNKVQHI